MKLYVMRHGPAEEQADSGVDSDRSLTPTGRERVRNVARALRDSGEAPANLMTSPLVRAVQTAEIVAVTTELGKRQGQVEVRREFGLGASDAEVIVKRARDEGRKRLMVVGHEPDLTRLVSILQQAPFSRPFDKSMVVSLHLKSSGAPATVRFVLDPKSLDFEWEP